MSQRYYYDRDGNLKGYSSTSNAGRIGAVLFLAIAFFVICFLPHVYIIVTSFVLSTAIANAVFQIPPLGSAIIGVLTAVFASGLFIGIRRLIPSAKGVLDFVIHAPFGYVILGPLLCLFIYEAFIGNRPELPHIYSVNSVSLAADAALRLFLNPIYALKFAQSSIELVSPVFGLVGAIIYGMFGKWLWRRW